MGKRRTDLWYIGLFMQKDSRLRLKRDNTWKYGWALFDEDSWIMKSTTYNTSDGRLTKELLERIKDTPIRKLPKDWRKTIRIKNLENSPHLDDITPLQEEEFKRTVKTIRGN